MPATNRNITAGIVVKKLIFVRMTTKSMISFRIARSGPEIGCDAAYSARSWRRSRGNASKKKTNKATRRISWTTMLPTACKMATVA